MEELKNHNEIETQDIQEDIEYLRERIEEMHPDPYRNVSKETLLNSLGNATKQENINFLKISIQESLALMKDAHTRVRNIIQEWYPIETEILNDENQYIIGTTSQDRNFLGAKIDGINGVPIKDVHDKISNISSKENHEQLLKDLNIFSTCGTVLNYHNITQDKTATYNTSKGDLGLSEVSKPVREIKKPLGWENEKFIGNKQYRFKESDGVLQFQYNKCEMGDYSEKELKEFKKKLLESANIAKYIVVDLRQNQGGSTEIMRDALDKLPRNKPIYVATGRRTFSSAMHHLIDLKKIHNAIQIGENAGQRPNRFGQGEDITLPNSKINIHCSVKDFQLMPDSNLEVLKPDIYVPLTINDYINETDPLQDWIKEHLT